MKTKRIFALLLSLIMLLGVCNVSVLADETEVNTIKTYITVSKYGEIINNTSGNAIASAEIELSDKSVYTLDDVFKAAHDLYYDGGSNAGYNTATGDFGLYITKFWGDESGNFGYQVNHGTESVMGLVHEVENGDYIDVCIYKNFYPDTESYTRFDKSTAETLINENVELTLEQSGYDEKWNTVFSACEDATITVNGEETAIRTDAEGKATLSFDTVGEYVVSAVKTKVLNEETVPAITAPICMVTVKDYPDAQITVPANTSLYVGQKDGVHFVKFTEIQPLKKIESEESATYYFELEGDKTYNYRITSDDYITYAGKFKKTADYSLNITDEMLAVDGKTKTTVDRDTASNNGFNVADIYLNINPQGHLKLNVNDTYQIVNLRNWEAVDSTTANYFIEPDYHYTVIDENGEISNDVVIVDENGTVTAVNTGTAIVLVTYDAMNLDFGSGADFYGAIWPENTGVFVVSVGMEDSGIVTGMTINEGKNNDALKLSGDAIDAEHDVIYYIGANGSYTFTPETEGVSVSVANPVVDTALTYNGFAEVTANTDGSYSVSLKNGRNIVKVEKDGKAEYQVITAKEVKVTINNDKPVHAGDTVSVVFDTLYHPSNKLACVYNMNASAVYTNVSGYDGKIIGGLSAQYNFANNENAQNIANVLKEKDVWGVISYEKDTDLVVPENYKEDTFILSGGMLYVSGWGDSYGNHRGITYENGKGVNLNADAKIAWLGMLPDIEIPIVKSTQGGSGSASDSITVYFTLYGDEKHGEPSGSKDTHTMKSKNLETWVEKTKVTVEKGSTVLDAVKKALGDAQIQYTYDDDYISEVNGLKEFDNGTYSGWMYTINGKYATVGISEKKLSNGDKIVLHYTDDYTKEKSAVSSSSGGGGGSSVSSSTKNDNEEKTGEVTEENIQEETKEEQIIFTDDTFADVSNDDWYYDAVKYVYENNLMQGTDNGFEADSKMTRAMLVTVLYRLENPSEETAASVFEDVNENTWYAKAVAWATENDIVSGISETEFAPEDNVSREQMAMIFYRYAKFKRYNTEETSELSQFTDKAEISDWSLEALKWANAAKIISGTSDTEISPKDTATRGQVASILMRFCERTK